MVYAPKPAAQPVNQQMLEACKSMGHPLPDSMLVIHRRCKDAIAQVEDQQVQQTQFEPQADDHDRPIETSEGDAREYTKGGAA